MKNRIPTQVAANGALRYGNYDAAGALINHMFLKIDDEPIEPGTPFDDENVLSADTAINMGMTPAAVPDDAFAKLTALNSKAQATANKALPKRLIATILSSVAFDIASYGLNIGDKIDIYMTGGGASGERGSNSGAGKGGGGGYCRFIRNYKIDSASYSLIVGAGATGSTTSYGEAGGNTSGFGYTAPGGGSITGTIGEYSDGGSGGGGTPGGDGGFGGSGGSGGTYSSSFYGSGGKGGGNIEYQPFNPYDGIFYGSGGGAGGRLPGTGTTTASSGGRGGGAGGYGTAWGSVPADSPIHHGFIGGGGAGGNGQQNDAANMYGGNGGIGGGGGGGGGSHYSMTSVTYSRGGDGGKGIIYVYSDMDISERIFTTAGSANAYTVQIPTVTAYNDGDIFTIRFHAANTSATVNININSLGNRRIYTSGTTNPTAGGIPINSVWRIKYFSTYNGFNLIERIS